MREYTEQHIIELIKKNSKNSGGGGGGGSTDFIRIPIVVPVSQEIGFVSPLLNIGSLTINKSGSVIYSEREVNLNIRIAQTVTAYREGNLYRFNETIPTPSFGGFGVSDEGNAMIDITYAGTYEPNIDRLKVAMSFIDAHYIDISDSGLVIKKVIRPRYTETYTASYWFENGEYSNVRPWYGN